MPLPLPDLDTRTWDDLVAEARALIPRYAPGWTDHNLHDPGITLIDLLAWLVEMDIYTLDRVPEVSRRRFLALVGNAPRPPRAATAVLTCAPAGPASVAIPAGAEFALTLGDRTVHRAFATAGVVAAPVQIAELLVQPDPAAPPREAVRFRREGGAVAALGDDPAPGAALWLGFDHPLPVDQPFRFHVTLAGGHSGSDERQRIELERAARAEECRRPLPLVRPCAMPATAPAPTSPPMTPDLLRHHAVRLVWEIDPAAAPTRPRALDPNTGEVRDDTRDLSLDGFVEVRAPADLGATAPDDGAPRPYLRARLVAGAYDAPPLVAGIALNAFPVRQAVPLTHPFRIAPGATVTGTPPALPGPARLRFTLDASGAIAHLTFDANEQNPMAEVLAFQAPTAVAAGLLLAELAPLGRSDGAPWQSFALPGPTIEGESLEVFTIEDAPPTGAWQRWEVRANWDASGGRDAHVLLDRRRNRLVFPNGDRGRIPAPGAAVLARGQSTGAAAANSAQVRAIALPPTLRNWALFRPDDLDAQLAALGVDALLAYDQDVVWEQLSAATFAATVRALGALAATTPPAGGAAAETVAEAAARAVAALAAPTRAITATDVETLALATPGTNIARVQALTRQHPALPCLVAPGIITVIVVPAQRRKQPAPSDGLLATVLAYLERRRLVGTRLFVVGPTYLRVSVTARVRARFDASPERVRGEVIAALDAFLDPLRGGPAAIAPTLRLPAPGGAVPSANGNGSGPIPTIVPPPATPGWPFGRDVYRAEVLQVIDGVAGVDHVLSLELSGDGSPPQCGNLCLGPTQLVTPGPHQIEVVR